MNLKLSLVVVSCLTASSLAYGGEKVAEYGDPVIGNSYNDCEFDQVYGTGGGGYVYREYEVECPGYDTFTAGVVESWHQYPVPGSSCSFYPDDGYYMHGNCDNWRVYLDD